MVVPLQALIILGYVVQYVQTHTTDWVVELEFHAYVVW